jgi:hypothetical protein
MTLKEGMQVDGRFYGTPLNERYEERGDGNCKNH